MEAKKWKYFGPATLTNPKDIDNYIKALEAQAPIGNRHPII